MIIDGKKIALDIKKSLQNELAKTIAHPMLFAFIVGDDPVTENFLTRKKRFAEDLALEMRVYRFPISTKEQDIQKAIADISSTASSGIIVQLPLPSAMNTDIVVNAVPLNMDVDVLSKEAMESFEEGTLPIVPPVVGAIEEVLERNSVSIKDKNIVVIGRGRLVGEPSAIWFRKKGGLVSVVDEYTKDIKEFTRGADIIVSGAGVPNLLKPDMLKEGVVILDAGASESKGNIVGDVDPECFPKCGIITPVPGGLGPITVAMVFKNLIALTKTNDEF